jgi:hypothetical protein
MSIERILLSSKGNAIRKSEVVPGETPTVNATIRPGELIEFDASYNASPQSTDAEDVPARRFAVPNVSVGMSIDDDYTTSGDFQGLEYAVCPPGEAVYAWLLDGESVDVGDKLVPNGDGTLRAFVDGTDPEASIVAQAMESAAPSGSDARLRVEVL